MGNYLTQYYNVLYYVRQLCGQTLYSVSPGRGYFNEGIKFCLQCDCVAAILSLRKIIQ